MALKPCRECGKEVSTTAKACPHCGVAYPASKVQAAGKNMMAVGCLLTLFITIPVLVVMCMAM